MIETSPGIPFGTIGVLTAVFIIMLTFFGLVTRFSGSRSTDQIKSRKTGDGQYGSARFATPKEKKQMFRAVRFEPDVWRKNGGGKRLPQGIVV
ncbi:MAG: hypothetical protein J5843_01635, partial [Clostridia bacterium]|nr:hypothetical protein [Clostridia bacterium]